MSRKWESLIGGVTVLGLAVAAAAGLMLLREKPQPPERTSSDPVVATVVVESDTGGFEIDVDGFVVPHRRISLAAEVAGRIVEKNDALCCAGRYVTAGTLLARIDDRDYVLEVRRLKQEERQAKASLKELSDELVGTYALIELSKEDVAIQEGELDRLRRLGRNVSITELENAKSKLLAARRMLTDLQNQHRLQETRKERLQAAIDLVTSRLEKAKLDLERTRIVAPVAGMIVEENVEQDDYVQRGSPLLTIEDTSKVEVKCKLELGDLYWIWGRQEAQAAVSDPNLFQLPAQPNVTVTYELPGWQHRHYHWKGRLDRFEGFGLDTRTRTVPCRVVIDEPRRHDTEGPPVLLPGMYVTVRIPVTPDTRLLRVPERALRPGNVVWRVRNDRLDLVPVELVKLERHVAPPNGTLLSGAIPSSRGAAGGASSGATSEGKTAIIQVADPGALGPGDRVVVSPLEFVKSGMPVRSHPDHDATDETTAVKTAENEGAANR